MNRVVVYSNIAKLDLKGIRDYIAEHNPSAAVSVLIQIKEECRQLGSMPFAGPAYGESHPGLRFRVVGKYVVFYRVTDDRVWIQRVLHSARDFGKLL